MRYVAIKLCKVVILLICKDIWIDKNLYSYQQVDFGICHNTFSKRFQPRALPFLIQLEQHRSLYGASFRALPPTPRCDWYGNWLALTFKILRCRGQKRDKSKNQQDYLPHHIKNEQSHYNGDQRRQPWQLRGTVRGVEGKPSTSCFWCYQDQSSAPLFEQPKLFLDPKP